jgi:thimet oligopeptidase
MKRLTLALAALLVSGAAMPATQPAALGASALLTVGPKQFLKACRADMAAARAGMAKLKALKRASALQTLEAYDIAQWTLGRPSDRAGLAHETHPDRALRDAAEQCDREVSALATDFSLDRGIYQALVSVDGKQLDAASRHYLERTLLQFRLAGVDRDDATRARIKQINDELVQLSQDFNRNIREGVLKLEVTPAELDGLPADFVKAHPPGADGKVTLTTDNTDYVPVMSYARSPALREQFWKLYRLRAHPKNLPVLDRMLAKRHELATLLGFANWADYVTADKMIGSGAKASEFIEKIASASDPRAAQDYALLLARKKKDDPAAAEVKPWDSTYLSDRIKAEQYGVESREVRPYFQYDRVKNAVLELTGKLFGIRYQRVLDARVWHPEVETYDVYEGTRRMGRIYLDMHPREAKYKHYAQFPLVSGKRGVALPEGVLVCNFNKPSAGDPGLLEYEDTVTFLHEFGHLLHHVLGGHTRWGGTSGVATERDFVEAPSQMLEEWAHDPKTLQSMAVHYQTQQPIPLALADKIRAADEFGKGLMVRQQMFYAATSLGLHDRDPKGLDTTQFVAQAQERYTPYKYVPGTYLQTSFGHLDGYSAVYYTYMWSLVIAKDMFSAFSATGNVMDATVASRYRRAVLEPGGSQPAAQLVQDFLGRPYSFKSYENWLNAD